MNAAINRQIRLAARPVGMLKVSDFSLAEEPESKPAMVHSLMDGAVTVDN